MKHLSTRSIPFGIGVLLIGVQAAALYLQALDLGHWYLIALLFEGVLFALASWVVVSSPDRAGFGLILLVAATLRLMVLIPDAYNSTDVFRYVWDGRVQAAGINPYAYVPNDPHLEGLRDETIWPKINRADYAPTIYPPASQIIFLLISRLSETVLAFKAAFMLFDAATIAILLRLLRLENLPRERILLYAWCPLPIWEFTGGAHVDAAMTTFVVAALWARRQQKDGLAGIALGLAVLVKFLPIVLFPAFWRRWQWKLPLALGLTIVVGYLPYLGAGEKVFGFLSGYVSEEGIREGSGFMLLRIARGITALPVPSIAYIAVVALVLASLALLIWRRAKPSPLMFYGQAAMLATTVLIALSPGYPWYLAWLVPFFCLVPNATLLWLASSSFILYWLAARSEPWMAQTVYGGAILTALGSLAFRPRAPTLERNMV